MIIKIKSDDKSYDMLFNIDNILYIVPRFDGGYRIQFTDKTEMEISYKEYDRISKAMENSK